MKKKEQAFRSKRKKRSTKDIIFDVIVAIILIWTVCVTLYPIINTIAVSFNDGLDALRGGIYLWPRKWSLESYESVIKKDSMFIGLKISTLRTVIGTIAQLACTALLAFIVSRKEFVFKKQLSLLYVLTMYVNGGLIPTFILYRALGFVNSFSVYIIPGLASAWNMLVIRTYMHGLPDSLEESAKIDGAGYFTVFTKVIVPLCKPVFATIALFIAVGQWNSWFDTLLYNKMSPELTTLQYELQKFFSSVTSASSKITTTSTQAAPQISLTTIRSAATVLTSIPIVMLYPFLQRYFVTGLTIGGVKE